MLTADSTRNSRKLIQVPAVFLSEPVLSMTCDVFKIVCGKFPCLIKLLIKMNHGDDLYFKPQGQTAVIEMALEVWLVHPEARHVILPEVKDQGGCAWLSEPLLLQAASGVLFVEKLPQILVGKVSTRAQHPFPGSLAH